MKLLRKTKSILLLLLCLFLLAGCTVPDESTQSTEPPSNAPYAVERIEGSLYLVFEDAESYKGSATDAYVYFDDFAQFKERVLSADLTEEELRTVVNKFPTTAQGIPTWDLINKPYVPITPKEISIPAVAWQGTSYYFREPKSSWLSLEFNKLACNVVVLAEEEYQQQYQAALQKFSSGNMETVTYKERECTSAQIDDKLYLRYPLTQGEKAFVVEEIRRVSSNAEDPQELLSLPPDYLIIYAEEGEEKFYEIHISDFSQSPTDEWLLSFGLTEYTE